jgi:hypothetical protein
MKSILKGKNISKSHSTYNEVAGTVINLLKKFPEVSKIVIGPIKPDHARQRRIKVSLDKGNVRVQCRDISSVQYLWILGVSDEFVIQKLTGIIDEL